MTEPLERLAEVEAGSWAVSHVLAELRHDLGDGNEDLADELSGLAERAQELLFSLRSVRIRLAGRVRVRARAVAP